MYKKFKLILLSISPIILVGIVFYLNFNNFNATPDIKYYPPNLILYINNLDTIKIDKSSENWFLGYDKKGNGILSSTNSRLPYETLINSAPLIINKTDKLYLKLNEELYSKDIYVIQHANIDIYDNNKLIKNEELNISNNEIILDVNNINEGVYYYTLSVDFKDRGTVTYNFKIEIKAKL